MTMKIDAVSTVLVGEYLFFGLTLFTNADYFWNPEDGLFRCISYVQQTELESNHLDPIAQVIATLHATGLLSLALLFLVARDTMTKNDALRTALYNSLLLFLVFAHAFIFIRNKYLNIPIVGLYTGVFFTHTLWLFTKVLRQASTKDILKRTPARFPHLVGIAIAVIFLGFLGLADLLDPHIHDPGKSLPFFNKTTLPNNKRDGLAIFMSHIQGAFLLTFAFSALEVLTFDRSVERIRWSCKRSAALFALYVVVHIRAALDDTGYINKSAWVRAVVELSLFLLGSIMLGFYGAVNTKRDIATKETTIDSSGIPELATEDNKKLN